MAHVEDYIAELEKHIAKLHESNAQLLIFYEETQETEYATAIEENKLVIARKMEQVVELRATLDKVAHGGLGPLADDEDDDMADVIDMTARKK
jgi:hypothetical protein